METKAEADIDIMRIIINEGIQRIYEQYTEGKYGKKAALVRLASFLDSKGVSNFPLIAMATTKDWRR